MSVVIQVENLSKYYRLGLIGGGTLREDLNRWWAKARGRPDPLLKIGETDHGNRVGGELWALRDVSFQVREGEILGIIGRNGAGKSTLLKILSRITAPTSGQVKIKGRVGSLLEVGTGFHPELTGRENIYLNGAILGMKKAEIDSKLDEIIDFAEIEQFMDTPVKRYSSGMYVRLAFAVAAHLEPEVLIVDEVLAVGDDGFQKKCLGKMRDVATHGRTVLFVSHNMAAIQRLCERAIWLQQGLFAASGTPAEIVARYLGSTSPAPRINRHFPIGTLFQNQPEHLPGGAAITELALLDKNFRPIANCQTWDRICFRITFLAEREFRSLSAEFTISTKEGIVLILTSSTPDQAVPFGIPSPGFYRLDCIFDRLPLAAGEYRIGLMLALPGVEYIWREDSAAWLSVTTADVYNSGLPPSDNRYFIATEHQWFGPEISHESAG